MAMAAMGQEAEATCLQSFELYESESRLYILGTNSDKTLWRLLKIDRLESSELDIDECSTVYTESEYPDLLKGLNEDHRSTGGVNFVTKFYGIIGFIKFLGPYYMLIITEQKKIGEIFGHPVYQMTKTSMVELANSKTQSSFQNSKEENRYKKILNALDLRKDFFFSYSYHIMRSLQKNLSDPQDGWTLYETMFVWNEFLTRWIRNCLRNTLWTVALVYGFFKQDKFSVSGKDIMFTLIARRSRRYAGTRYLKRGVNEKGRVANDVETEQIVYEAVPGPTEVSSVVQNRGSIPLFWSQETSKLNLKPNIILHEMDNNYEATKLHFENLRGRYGNPIIILNLIKTRERRESILRREFDKAIRVINNSFSEENHLRFLHWDLHQNSQGKPTNVLDVLLKVAFRALSLTEFFYCQVASGSETAAHWPALLSGLDPYLCDDNSNSDNTECTDIVGDISQEDISGSSDFSGNATTEGKVENSELPPLKPPKFQKGVLRTNCIDCLDRTNVAQYAYGLAALGHQLHALGSLESPELGLEAPLAHHLMHFYERMGDTLAVQYSGSAAHNKIFSAKRGHLKLFIRSQEFFRTLQRHYSNTCIDANKQAAINLFLGYFQPQQGKPALWELESSSGEHNNELFDDCTSTLKRVKSDGSILRESNTSISGSGCCHNELFNAAQPDVKSRLQFPNLESDSMHENEISSACESGVSNLRYTPTAPHILHVPRAEPEYVNDSGDSNFLDLECLSTSSDERSIAISTSDVNLSNENVISDINPDCKETQIAEIQAQKLPEHFVQWVNHGDTFWY
ncbi:phosphoinositide phosphatase SAC3-like [Phragmites australis]|uniref:phosphoinositide phosphatase SAC3-like n=1 Tax=Phragmites australis TaxID=29695 RepID=UPI002D78BAD1|nr:phosphoinositide phosphatase SAC3-like [Phragmites australis]